MGDYEDKQAADSRSDCKLFVITLERCTRTFSAAPCTATGEPCYGTFKTCKDKTNFASETYDLKYCSVNIPKLPFDGVRPYLKSVDYMPTEIKDNKTIIGRHKFTLLDEPDGDIGIDPYVTQRAAFPEIPGDYFKKLIARNELQGRPAKAYDGFIGIAEVDFVQKVNGTITNIERAGAGVRFEVVDLVKSLSDITVPEKVDIQLAGDLGLTDTIVSLTSLDGLNQPAGYITHKDEIIYYSNVDTTKKQLNPCTREYEGTTAAEGTKGDKIEKARLYYGDPYDILNVQMLQEDAGIDTGDINEPSFNKTWPIVEIPRKTYVTKQTKLSDLYFDLVGELDGKSWIAEDLKIVFAKNMARNDPYRIYSDITDRANIVFGPDDVDLNLTALKTRLVVYFNKSVLGDASKEESYASTYIYVDADAEGPNGLNKVVEKVIMSRWLWPNLIEEGLYESYINANFGRILFRLTQSQEILKFKVELKDGDVHTGAFIKATTKAIQNIDGTSITDEPFQIIKRDPGEKGKISLAAVRLPQHKVAFFSDRAIDYDTATDEEKEMYGFWAGSDGLVDGEKPYNWY